MKDLIFAAILSVCLTGAAAHGQLAAGGTVHDPSGAVVPGALVTAKNGPGNSVVLAKTDAEGDFHLELPAVGTYQLVVEADGFIPARSVVVIDSEHQSQAVDVLLQIAGSTQTVEVTADALRAETTSTQLGEVFDIKKIQSVPLNGRSFTDLIAVQPGIVPQNTAQPGAVIMTGVASTPPSGDANSGNLSISGQRETSNGFRVNGSDVEEDVNMGTSIVPNLDAIESFRVLTSNFDAEFGNSSGGQILVETKAGTSQLRGTIFNFLRNTAFDAKNYFSQDRAAYRQNQFGGTLGGSPLHIKGLTLFGDYQGTRLTEGIDTGNIAVPTEAERRGDFAQAPLTGSVSGNYLASLLSARLGRAVKAGETYAQVFQDGQIPESAWSAPARYLLASIPQPNAGSASFASSRESERLQDDKGALRTDWTHGSGTLTAYYFLDNFSLDNPFPTGTGGANIPGFDATSNGRAQLMSLAHTNAGSNSTLNQFHLSFMRNNNAVGQPRGGVGPSLTAQGFTGIIPLKTSIEGIENLAFNDFTLGVDTTALVQAENIYETSDAFSLIRGRHGVKVGGELHVNQINTHPDVVFNGSFAFNGSETGQDFADFLLGTPSSYTQGQARDFYNRNIYLAAFLQDSWKATDHLTLNYGVRWDRIRPWSEKFNQLQTLVKGEQSQVFPQAPRGLLFPGDPGVASSLAGARHDIAPRIGVAWAPAPGADWISKITGQAGQTSIRLGYGMFYTAYEGLSAGIMSANPPYGYTYTSAAPPLFESPFTVAATGTDAGQRFPLQTVAFGASRAHPNSTVDWSQFEPLVGIPAVDPTDVTPYAEHWMASVERQFRASTLATISYVGAASHHLLVLEEANPADPGLCLSLGPVCGPFNEQAARTQFGPNFGSVELQRTIANANYHALEMMLSHRVSTLELMVSYTYSKSIDQSGGLPEPVNPVNPSLSRGLSAFDMRHNLVTSFHYDVPTLVSSGKLRRIASGWGIAGIVRFTSGLPVTLLNNNDTSLLGTIPNGINNNGVDTPEWSGGSLRLNTNARRAPVFDTSQFALPALGTLGTARRRFFSGPGMENFDATLSRTFHVTDKRVIEFRTEAFNIFNHAQFFGASAVQGNISSNNFGSAVSAMSPRLMQVALRYRF